MPCQETCKTLACNPIPMVITKIIIRIIVVTIIIVIMILVITILIPNRFTPQ